MYKSIRESDKTFLKLLEEEIQVELEPYLRYEIQKEKEEFLNWLYKLVIKETDDTISIDYTKLKVLLFAVNADLIEIENLLYSLPSKEDIVKRTMKEYDLSGNSFIKEKFHVLADFILALYG
jgi:hypothetical protein